MIPRFAALLWFLLVVSPSLHAQGVLPDKSEIRFISKQMGANVEGKFRKFKANVIFLPGNLPASKAELEIDLNSIDLASEEAEIEAKRKPWFNTQVFPIAKFASTAVKNIGGDRYEMTGKLTIKGVSRDLVIPITLKRDSSGTQTAEGSFSLKRLDFKLGEGPWADTDTVADDIAVRVRMVLPPASAAKK